MSGELRSLIRQHFRVQFEKREGDDNVLLAQLPRSLRVQATAATRSASFSRLPRGRPATPPCGETSPRACAQWHPPNALGPFRAQVMRQMNMRAVSRSWIFLGCDTQVNDPARPALSCLLHAMTTWGPHQAPWPHMRRNARGRSSQLVDTIHQAPSVG